MKTNLSLGFGIALLIVLFYGEPDIHDALIHRLMHTEPREKMLNISVQCHFSPGEYILKNPSHNSPVMHLLGQGQTQSLNRKLTLSHSNLSTPPMKFLCYILGHKRTHIFCSFDFWYKHPECLRCLKRLIHI